MSNPPKGFEREITQDELDDCYGQGAPVRKVSAPDRSPEGWPVDQEAEMAAAIAEQLIAQGLDTKVADIEIGSVARAALLAAAPASGAERTKEFLAWLAERLIHVYHESPNVDFVLKLRELAAAPSGQEWQDIALSAAKAGYEFGKQSSPSPSRPKEEGSMDTIARRLGTAAASWRQLDGNLADLLLEGRTAIEHLCELLTNTTIERDNAERAIAGKG